MRAFHAKAELRRLHADGEWWLAGVLLGDRWHPVKAGVSPPTLRAIEARLVSLEPLPPIVARDERHALAVARWVALSGDRPVWSASKARDVSV